MRAMVLERTGPAETTELRARELPDPEPGPGEVVIRVAACGVCHTDLHLLEGEVSARLPVVPGHQAAGLVERAGPNAGGLREGDAVGVGWLFRTCGRCVYCRSGRENLCTEPLNTGRHRNGGFAGKLAADARFAYPLPAGISPAEAAPLLCAGIIGYRTLRLSAIAPGGRLGLVGFGASAHLAIQVALHWKCEVFVFTREEHHRALAREMGAAWAGSVSEDPGVPLDAIATFAPAGELVPAMLPRLARGAAIAVNAIHASPIPSFPFEALYWERRVTSVANYTRQDAEEFLALSAAIPVRARTEIYPLDQANEALRRLKAGEIRGAAVLAI